MQCTCLYCAHFSRILVYTTYFLMYENDPTRWYTELSQERDIYHWSAFSGFSVIKCASLKGRYDCPERAGKRKNSNFLRIQTAQISYQRDKTRRKTQGAQVVIGTVGLNGPQTMLAVRADIWSSQPFLKTPFFQPQEGQERGAHAREVTALSAE